MSLRLKTLLATAAMIVGFTLLALVLARFIVLRSFSDLEAEHAQDRARRARTEVIQTLNTLGTVANTLASLDDTRSLLDPATQNTAAVDAHLERYHLNMVIAVDRAGQVVAQRGYDTQFRRSQEVPAEVIEKISLSPLYHPTQEESTSGLLLVPQGALLVASSQFPLGEGAGDSSGVLIIGRYLDAAEQQRISEIAQLNLNVQRLDEDGVSPDLLKAIAGLTTTSAPFWRTPDQDTMSAYAVMYDAFGNPALLLRVDLAREYTAQGEISITYLFLVLLLVITVFMLLLTFWLDRQILSRMIKLGERLRSIGASGDLTERVVLVGHDEVTELASAINDMLARLEVAQDAHHESEARYAALFSQAADGILLSDPFAGVDGPMVTEASDSAIAMYGYTREELRGMSTSALEAPSSRTSMSERVARLMSGEPLTFESEHQRKDGSRFPVEVSARMMVIGSHHVIQSMSRNVTERKRSERLQSILSHIAQAAATSESIEDLLGATHRLLGTLMDCASFQVMLHDSTQSAYWEPYRSGRANKPGIARLRHLEHALADSIRQSGAPLMANREECERVLGAHGFTAVGVLPAAWLGVPLKTSEGIIGVVSVQSENDASTFSSGDMELLQYVSSQIAGALERQQAEKALRDSEQRYRSIYETAANLIIAVDADGMIVDCNSRSLSTLGYSQDAMIGQPLSMVLHPESVAPAQAAVQQVLRGKGFMYDREYRLVRRDGSVLDVSVNASPLLGAHDEADHVLCIVDDITERKAAEARLALLNTAMEQTVDAVILTDTAGTIEYVNPSFVQTTGYSREEAIGRNPRILNSGRQDADFYQAMWRTLEAGQVWSGTLVNQAKDGSQYQVQATISPVLDERGQISHYVAIQRDVTQQRSLEEQLRQSQKMEAIGRLAGGIAHDFNNLLTVINGYSETIVKMLNPADSLRQDVEEILKAGKRASALTQQLLAFSRRQRLETRVVNLNEILERMGRMLQRIIGEDVNLELGLCDTLGNARADPSQIEQVIVNLAVNARDAMEGGGTLTLQTANAELDEPLAREFVGAKAGSYVVLTVKDTGCGMSSEVKAHLFEPFFTTKKQGKGTGLGLATVFGIVQQSGGIIDCQSKVGHGTAFRVFLPRVEDSPEEKPEDTPTAEVTRGTETVLVVEDQDEVRELTARMLRRLGYSVFEAGDGVQALHLFASHTEPFNMVLTDVIMPEMSGPELVDKLRQERPSLPVLYMTGYAFEALSGNAVESLGDLVIHKPFTFEELALKVRQVLESAPTAEPSASHKDVHED
ncbi:MAG: PAS domain S-box protein [Anaerolineae bacterium]